MLTCVTIIDVRGEQNFIEQAFRRVALDRELNLLKTAADSGAGVRALVATNVPFGALQVIGRRSACFPQSRFSNTRVQSGGNVPRKIERAPHATSFSARSTNKHIHLLRPCHVNHIPLGS